MSGYHIPIMLNEVIDLLKPERGGCFVDGTLGGGGHSSGIFAALPNNGSMLYGIDRDNEAIKYASSHIVSEKGKTFVALHGNFFDMAELLNSRGIYEVDGILLDLGVSSHQLDEPMRGFSYMADAPLDMRMDAGAALSAYDVVNGFSEEKLCGILFKFGEERYSKRIAGAIVKAARVKPIETTLELVSIIKGAMPAQALREKQHPAKRTFQAIRIAVNDELDGLDKAVRSAAAMLRRGGVIAVITFHSLEDRIIKRAFVEMERPCTCDPKAPMCVCGKLPLVKVLTRKPIVPGDDEINKNPRARSSKLRAAMWI